LKKRSTTTKSYAAKFTAYALEDVKALPRNTRNALKRELLTLLGDPAGGSEELGEPLAGFRSFHFRDYRVVFRIYEDLNAIAVVGIGDKSTAEGAYKRLELLASTGKLADSVLATLKLFQ